MAFPQIGEVHDGYRYSGGDPNQKGSWQFVGAQSAMPQAAAGAPGAAFMVPGSAPKLAPSDYGTIKAFRDQATTALNQRADANRFRSLNASDRTGGILGLPGIRDVRAMVDPQVSEMKAITEKLTPAQRAAASGAMSDSDAAMYRASTVGLDKPRQANDAMAKVISAGALRQSDMSAFYEEFAKRNGGLLGAQEAWAAYTNANPLFTKGQDGNTTVQGWTPWRKWFGLEQQPAGGAPAAQPGQTQAAAPAQPRVIHYDAQGRRIP